MVTVLNGSKRDLGDFMVTRILPNAEKRMVGPFAFFDHMGPATFAPGIGINVRPHPHIGLATLTYLFDGSILHRDSLGSVQEITPGDVNWMVAGRGIVHSERETEDARKTHRTAEGVQCWIALPEEFTEVDPMFQHISGSDLPLIENDGIRMRLIAGSAYGKQSPVNVYSPMFFLDIHAEQGARTHTPDPGPDAHDQAQEVGVYVHEGELQVGDTMITAKQFAALPAGASEIVANRASRFLLLGGAAFGNLPNLWWNFVAYHEDRFERARADWSEGNFPPIPDDSDEFIPLPDST